VVTARVAGALAIAALVVLHVAGLVRLATSGALDVDESEYLQAGVKMARGERIYADFFEHHAPFIFQGLSHLVGDDLGAYVVRARVLAGVCGAISLTIAAILIWRATRRLYAVAILIGGLMAGTMVYGRASIFISPEPPALALFLLGALLIASASRRLAAGAAGVGLITLSFFMNLKWPVSSLALVLAFVAGAAPARRVALAVVAAACALLLLVVAVDPRTYYDFMFLFNREAYRWSVFHRTSSFPVARGFYYCPGILRPWFVLPAAALVAFVAVRIRGAFADVRIVWGSLLILVASLIEIRFVYAYPLIWPQYFILWALAASATFAFVPQAVVALVPTRVKPLARSVAVVFALLALVQGLLTFPTGSADPLSPATARVMTVLRPGDTVFMGAFHPLGVRDASYYWFGFDDVVPAAIEFAATPRGRTFLPAIREEDLPPCRLERSLDPHLRFIGMDALRALPVAKACAQRLRARGVLVPVTPVGLYRVRRPGELQ
jgi:hypothetical protein